MQQPGMFAWSELATSDVEASGSFYKKVFGWNASMMKMPQGGDYTVFELNGKPVAGMIPLQFTTAPEGTPNHWFCYVAVADASEVCRSTVDSGGQIIREPWFVPEAGTIAILQAADGSHFGIIQPAPECE